MASKTVKVGSSVGLHARPASIIADAAGEFDEDIFLNLVGDCYMALESGPDPKAERLDDDDVIPIANTRLALPHRTPMSVSGKINTGFPDRSIR